MLLKSKVTALQILYNDSTVGVSCVHSKKQTNKKKKGLKEEKNPHKQGMVLL